MIRNGYPYQSPGVVPSAVHSVLEEVDDASTVSIIEFLKRMKADLNYQVSICRVSYYVIFDGFKAELSCV